MAKNLKIGSIVAKKDKKKEFSVRLAPGVEMSIRVKNKDGELIGEAELSDGAYLNMQTPAEEIAFLLDKEYITEEQAEERLENVPDYVKYQISVKNQLEADEAPTKSKNTSKSKPKSKIEDDDF